MSLALHKRRYYLSSLAVDVERFALAVRERWSVEIPLHWCMDLQMGEDQSRARTGHSADNLTTYRRLARNLLKRDKSRRRGIKAKQLIAGWNDDNLLRWLHF